MCRHRTVSALAIAAIVLTMAAPAFPAGAAGLRPDFQVPFPCGEGWKATTYSGHRGVDWNWGVGADDLGKPAVAAAAGVATPKWQSGYGYYVDVDHGGGWVTRYAHLLEDGRANGFVGQGEPVGLVGSTGRSTSPHLHFEQRADGQVVSPMWAEGVPIQPDGRTYVSANCHRPNPFGSNDAHGDGIEDMVARYSARDGASTVRLIQGAPRRRLQASRALDADASQLPPGSMLALGDANGTGPADLNAVLPDGTGVRVVTFPASTEGVFGTRRVRHRATWRFDRVRGLHSGDTDGDGIDDLLLPITRPDGGTTVRRLAGQRARALSPNVALKAGPRPLPVSALLAVGDTDGDGRADLNAAIPTATGVRVVTFRGRRDGTFGPRRLRYATDAWDPRQLRELHAGDINGDGVTDLVVRLVRPTGRSQLWVVLGGSSQSLEAVAARTPKKSALPTDARLAVGDTDADGRGDLNATYAGDSGSRFVTFPGQESGALGGPRTRYEDSWSFSRVR